MKAAIEATDRYGGRYPDPKTVCLGQCEGMGAVPVHRDNPNDEEGKWHDLWLVAEEGSPADDGYHFVKCPTCNGTGKRI